MPHRALLANHRRSFPFRRSGSTSPTLRKPRRSSYQPNCPARPWHSKMKKTKKLVLPNSHAKSSTCSARTTHAHHHRRSHARHHPRVRHRLRVARKQLAGPPPAPVPARKSQRQRIDRATSAKERETKFFWPLTEARISNHRKKCCEEQCCKTRSSSAARLSTSCRYPPTSRDD